MNTTLLTRSSSGPNVDLFRFSGPVDGKSVFKSTSGAELTVGHQPSNENKGFVTQRTVVKIARTKQADDTTSEVKGYVQFQMSFPTSEFTVTEVKEMVAELVNYLQDPERGSADGAIASTSNLAAVSRLYAGEP